MIVYLSDFLQTYQWFLGILLTAGLSTLLYFYLLRINNFLNYSEKFQINMRSYLLLDKIECGTDSLVYKDSKKIVEKEDLVDLALWFNLISDVGLLLKRGLIDEKLAFNRFGNNVFGLYSKHGKIITLLEDQTESRNIEFLFRRFRKLGRRFGRKQLYRERIARFFKRGVKGI